MLVVGLAAGFGGGFLVGQRVVPPSPRASAAEIPRAAPQPVVIPAGSFTGVPTAEALPPVEVQEPEAASAESGALQLESRPLGAEVYVDDVRVGTTPMTMNNVRAGAHQVRMELPGRRSWGTTVKVEAGVLAHVGASLE